MDDDLKDIRARYASARPQPENPALVRMHADVVNLLAAYDALATELANLLAERIRKLVEVAGSPALVVQEGLDQVWATVSCGVATCWPTPNDLQALHEQLWNVGPG